jgi:transcriptional regulator with XRE-family HTH domain
MTEHRILGGVSPKQSIPFHRRLQELLEQRGGDATQAWLADRSGLDRSLVSRLMRGDRMPTAETLLCIAPALEVSITQLVTGTDAEDRLEDASSLVRRSDYEGAVKKVIEYEGVIGDLRVRLGSLEETLGHSERSRRAAEQDRAQATADGDRARTELRGVRARLQQQQAELERYQHALARAVAEFGALQTQLNALKKELGDAKNSSKAAAVLAGIGAVTGVATLAHFLDGAPRKPGPRATKRRNT